MASRDLSPSVGSGDDSSLRSDAAVRFAIGKRLDRKGWDLVVIRGGAWAAYGPYRLQREARHALAFGDYVSATPHSEGAP